jgi:bacteriocin biosynthesis cyclodehydratase domain-containing protein
MLIPGVRLVDRPGALHYFDGRRVVSLRGDEAGRDAIRQAIGAPGSTAAEVTAGELRDASELLVRLQLGVVGEAELETVPPAAAFASAEVAGWTTPGEAADRLRDTQVHVWDGPAGGLVRALTTAGIRARSLAGAAEIQHVDPACAVIAVVASDERPLERLRTANAACLTTGVPWLPISAYDGAVLHVGPLMIPGQTGCAECLQRRLAANVAYADVFGEITDAPAAPTLDVLRDWSYSVATLTLLRWIANRDARVPGRLFTLVPDEVAVRQATVFRVPRCSACAAPDFVTAAAPWGIARDH